MTPQFRPAERLASFLTTDGSGVAIFNELSGDTHFLHVDPVGFGRLLSHDVFGLDDLRTALALDDESATDQLSDRLVELGIIDEVG